MAPAPTTPAGAAPGQLASEDAVPGTEGPSNPDAAVRPGGIVVLDAGGQYARLIARRIRELGTWAAILPVDASATAVAAHRPAGIVISGGPASVNEDGAPGIDPAVLDLGLPTLGICYGMQLVARELGGEVAARGDSEYGRTTITRIAPAAGIEDVLPAALPDRFAGWMSHRDTVTALPPGAHATATSPLGIAAFAHPQRRAWGVQFHPEVVHTEHGRELLEGFVHGLAGAHRDWTSGSIIGEQVERIRAQAPGGAVICALSGGVDSTVAATLVHRAIGDRLSCVFVDHGLMRAGEADEVMRVMVDQLHVPVERIDAADRFLGRLAGVEDPEAKRRIIGEEFIRVFEEHARAVGDARHLVQGTLYSDVIESGHGSAGSDGAVIKSHHNVGGLPADMDLALVEPLRLLFKDEVRRVGRELGIPAELVDRQPFPGPGLAIRILGEVTPERVTLVREADAIIRRELDAAGAASGIWQAFAVLPGIRSVGVQGDGRSYADAIVIRAVTSDDAMTADWARIDHELIDHVSRSITNALPGINRVLLDVTSKPPATIEWE